MKMIMFVLNDPGLLDDVLDAWYGAGVTGITVVESTGVHRRRAHRIGARYPFGHSRLADGTTYEGHYTLYAAVRDEDVVRRCLDLAEEIVGDLDRPDTGIFVSWDLSLAKGLPGVDRSPEERE